MTIRESLRLFELGPATAPDGATVPAAIRAAPVAGIDAPDGILGHARDVLRAEAAAVADAAERLDDGFVRAVGMLESCTGNVVVTGVGKAGLVARKISATLSSTGCPSHFLHPTEAMHGDLGAVRGDDLLLALSWSGETEEVTRLLPHVRGRGVPIVALTGRADSTLARDADVVVCAGGVREACRLGLAPSTSTTLLLALGDALALVTSARRAFTPEDFHSRHPGGALGRQLMQVEDVMRPLPRCRTAAPGDTVRAVFSRPLPARRTGAVMIVAADGTLSGIFTDSDLARLFERRTDGAIDGPIRAVMTREPATIVAGTRLRDAVALLEARRLSELPVVDGAGRPLGLLDIVDLVGLVPPELLDVPAVHAA